MGKIAEFILKAEKYKVFYSKPNVHICQNHESKESCKLTIMCVYV